MSKHTKGKWQVKKWDREHAVDGFETVITDSRGHGLFTSNQKGKSRKVEANANLIASAPEMLEMLKKLCYRWVGRKLLIDNNDINQELLHLIAKAEEGEE